MTTRQNVINLARIFEGYQEEPEARMNLFGRWYGMNGCAWCAEFVSAIFAWSGNALNIETPKGYSYCPNAVDWFRDRNLWEVSDGNPGDIVFYCWDGTGVAEHTGIVISANDDSIIAIEGNTGNGNDIDGGAVEIRERDRSLILGFGKPIFDGKDIGKLAADCPQPPEATIGLTSPNHEDKAVAVWLGQMAVRGWAVPAGKTVFDERVKDLVYKFQKDIGLEADGVLGPQTWIATWLEPIE